MEIRFNKKSKELKAKCDCTLSKTEKSKLQCGRPPEEEREEIFRQFWSYSWKEKKVFVKSCVLIKPTTRKRGTEDVSRRSTLTEFNFRCKNESHYCRTSTTKLYLEPLWESKAHLYRVYSNEFCKEKNIILLCIAAFHKEFELKNLSLYKPKKDLCGICVAFETKNLTEMKKS
ncbi:hypothetical protein RI129_009187 [Pyrocoelia pectoralis]|uniref:Uncharacterized protein n=1 Tax=Pyrocoelia pectoralis TaxID=417401 RepID=A0AAN7V6Z4_9COLE